MFSEIGTLIIQTAAHLYLLAVLLRLLLQMARADFYNPISQFLVRVTNPVLAPMRRVIPGLMGIDMAAVVLAILVQFAGIAGTLWVMGYSLPNVGVVLVWSVLGCLGMIVRIYFIAVLASIILSWVAPGSYHPAVILLRQLVEPVMAPFRKLLPPMGGLDLSPILLFLTINILLVVLRHMAMNVGLPFRLVMGL